MSKNLFAFEINNLGENWAGLACSMLCIGGGKPAAFDLERHQMETTNQTPAIEATQAPAIAANVPPAKNIGRAQRQATPPQPRTKLAFAMLQGFRPTAGAALYAHTSAVVELLNMRKGAKIPRATLTKIIGETAVKHHLSATGFFAQDAGGVYLSDIGKENPHWVKVDPELKAACIEVLTTGKPSEKLFKNPAGIKAIDA